MAKKRRKKNTIAPKPLARPLRTLALVKGAHYNPYRLAAFSSLRDRPEIAVFYRPDPFTLRDSSEETEHVPILCDTEAGPLLRRWRYRLAGALGRRKPRLLPFHDRLEAFDLIHSWDLYTEWSEQALIAHQRQGTPLCVTVWDTIPFHLERNPDRRQRKAAVAAGADCLIVHTGPAYRMLEDEGIDARRLIAMDPGVDTALFTPGPADRTALGLDPDDFVLHFPGWLLPRKGIEFLLLALNELIHDETRHGATVRLLVAGAGPGRDRIEQLMHRLKAEAACRFTGPLPYTAQPGILRAADLAILPGVSTPEWQEQYTLSLLETMACGVPVLTTPAGALPEGIEEAVVLSRPDDFVSLYEAVKTLIHNPAQREKRSKEGRKLAETRFALSKQAEHLTALYDSLMK